MANTKQSKKRIIQSEKHRQRNVSLRSLYRTHIKKVIAAVEKGEKTLAEATYKIASAVLDGMANKGIIHKNKAARHKSRLHALIKKMKG